MLAKPEPKGQQAIIHCKLEILLLNTTFLTRGWTPPLHPLNKKVREKGKFRPHAGANTTDRGAIIIPKYPSQ